MSLLKAFKFYRLYGPMNRGHTVDCSECGDPVFAETLYKNGGKKGYSHPNCEVTYFEQ